MADIEEVILDKMVRTPERLTDDEQDMIIESVWVHTINMLREAGKTEEEVLAFVSNNFSRDWTIEVNRAGEAFNVELVFHD